MAMKKEYTEGMDGDYKRENRWSSLRPRGVSVLTLLGIEQKALVRFRFA